MHPMSISKIPSVLSLFLRRKLSSGVVAERRPSYWFFGPEGRGGGGSAGLSHDTVGQLVDAAADRAGDEVAFVACHQSLRRTFAQFKKEVDRLASGLVSIGLRKGDRVALCAPNMYEWPVVQFATAKAGFILVNVNPAYQANELEYCLRQSGSSSIISVEEYATQKYYDILCSIVPDLNTARTGSLLESSRLPNLQSVILLSDKPRQGTMTYADLMNAGDSESDRLLGEMERLVQFDDAVNIQYTSGTTGNPKGATLTHHNIINNVILVGRRMGFHETTDEKPVLCCQVPLYHAFGCIIGTLTSVIFQFPCVFPSHRFNPDSSLKAIESEKCTVLYGTPTMYVDLLDRYKSHPSDLGSLKQVLVAGATCPESVLRDLKEKMGVPFVHIAYGCTENSPVVSIQGREEDLRNIYARAIPGIEYLEYKVIDDNGRMVPLNSEGELCTRGHMLFLGYWGQPDKTDEVVDETRWFHTGDLVKMNEEGYIEIIGRLKDMIIRGGENIYPQEIENFLHEHPSVLEAHVCGVPDERMGEELCVWIKREDKQQISEADIRSYCKGKISHFKIPRYIVFVDDFPKTVSGKVQKFKMRQMSIELLQLS